MKGFAIALALVASLSSSLARADEVEMPGSLQLALIDRSLTLPALTVAPTIRTDICYLKASSGPNSGGTGASLAAGIDIGLTNDAQIGLAAAMPLYPNADFGTVLLNGVYRLSDSVGLRVDVGYVRSSETVNGTSERTNSVVAGLGVPIRAKLLPILAFVGGSAAAMRFAPFVNEAFGSSSIYSGGVTPIFGSDLLNYTHLTYRLPAPFADQNVVADEFTLNVPLGVLFQPHERIAIILRFGYSLSFATENVPAQTITTTVHYFPVGLEASVAIVPQLDFGAAFFFLGPLSETMSTSEGSQSQTMDMTAHYADIRVISVYLQGRF